jgi:hypothetical protein
MQVVMNGTIITGFLMPIFASVIAPAITEYADYALLINDETAALPKLIIWDGESYENARAVRGKCALPNFPLPEPQINQIYNSNTPFGVRYPPQTFVIGGALTPGTSTPGYYQVDTLFGTSVANQPAYLINYPMYFEAGYLGTLWDRFHWIDDQKRNPNHHLTWSAKIELCCEQLQLLDVFNAGATGSTVKLPLKFYTNGVIKEITVDYETSDLGQNITLRGTA